ncbi:hypothetical protein D9756_002768 [Leucocoprinus leucothites]|uniref:Nephrocystin 3-like N-terminal domain-containing protein n=1 Tax=Leucocoprinus leucothites TaxID=201217 RepID=A0A8H5LLJ0_9AGAR|nr:hypothetical protein D9756_002768 [Leucoagaricus leucothites]
MDWFLSKTRAVTPPEGTASASPDGRPMRLESRPPDIVLSKSTAMATLSQIHVLAGNRHQDAPSSSANTNSLQINKQAACETDRSFRNSSDNEAPTRTSEEAKDTSRTSVSIYDNSIAQHSQDPRSHALNSAITPASHLQAPRAIHQDAPSLFANASGFQINNSTIIGSVVQPAGAVTLSFPDSYDGRKLKKALVEGLEFIPLAKECMPDTRVGILSDVDARLHDNKSSNIIWIKGFPGVGKSALASTIISRLRNRGELLSYFIFDRAKPTTSTTRALWRRVSWDLARLYPAARSSLLKRIDDETLDRGDLSTVRLRQPVVVVIDAADECGGLEGPRSDDRKTLLKTLEQWHSELPKNFKVVVTSREEDDIKRRISPISTHIHVSIGTNEASSDICKYLEGRLGDIASAYSELPVDWARQTANHLAQRAAGVFIWATTIANFIEAGEPQSQLEDIDAGLGLGGEEGSLYALYANILKISFKNLHGKQMEAFKCVVGAVIFAQRPFHNSEFAAISPVVTGSMLEYIRNGMRSVIDQGPTLRFVHQSFVDFLLSPGCPDEFTIREPEQQQQLSALCLTTMSKQLRFNICGLETSSLKNADVPDIETKVEVGIPPLLSYSCCFVADHLRHTAFDECLMDGMRVVFKEKLLYWLEAMSLLKEMHRVVPILRMVVDWITARDGVLTEFVRDALRFVMAFTIPMMQSAPHIYLSALPFAPEESLVAKYFLPGFPRLLALDTGKPSHWSPCVFVSEYHKAPIGAIAFSPDETIFASGDWDGKICIWDSATGILISGPLIRSARDVSMVDSLDFSPNGRYLVSAHGKQGMVIWDVESGREHLCFGDFSERPGSALLHGDTEEKITSAVYTKDGHMIVSRSGYGDPPYDHWNCCCRIQLWDASTGTLAHTLLDLPRSDNYYLLSPNAHFLASLSKNPVVLRVWDLTERPLRCVLEQDIIGEWSFRSSLAFSPDGKYLLVVTRTQEKVYMACIWRMDTCTLAGPTISLGPDFGSCVLYSPGNNNLVIGVHGTASVRMFDATTGNVVYCGKEPNGVECGSPSCGSRKILLGYHDGTIRMWDYHCHTSHAIDSATDDNLAGWVNPVFSPCGKTLAVSYKDEIKLLNTTTGEPINLSHPIQTKSVMLSFSHDGRYIASLMTHRYCDEPPVANIWDMNTGMNCCCLVITDAAKEGHFNLFFVPSDNQLVLHSSVEGGEEERYVIRIWGGNVLDEPYTTVTLPHPKSCNTNSRTLELLLSPDTLTALVLEHTTTGAIVHCHHRNSIEEQFTPHSLFNTAALTPNLISWWGRMAAFSPSGQLFVSAGSVVNDTGISCQLRVWETKTWTEIAGPFEGGEVYRWGSPFVKQPTFLSVSPDDCLIHFVSPGDGAIWVWDIHTGREVAGPWRGYDLRRAFKIIMSPDGDKLASTNYGLPSTVRLWNTHGLCSGQAQELVGGIGDFGDQSLIRDGWVKEEGSDSLLFWVPAEHRDRLWQPRNIAVIGVAPTKLDFSRFKYGRDWEECIDKEYTT